MQLDLDAIIRRAKHGLGIATVFATTGALIWNMHSPRSIPAERTLTGNEAAAYACMKEYITQQSYDLKDAPLYMAIIRTESNFDPLATSPTEAVGMMQLRPIAVQEVQRTTPLQHTVNDRTDLCKNIQMGIEYVRGLEEKFDDEGLAIIAYNMGEGRVREHMPKYFPVDGEGFAELLRSSLIAEQLYDSQPLTPISSERRWPLMDVNEAVRLQALDYFKKVTERKKLYHDKIRNFELGIPIETHEEPVAWQYDGYSQYRPPLNRSVNDLVIPEGGEFGAKRGEQTHDGLDVSCQPNEQLFPITKGTVYAIDSTDNSDSGIWISFRTERGSLVHYLHLNELAPNLKPGDSIDHTTLLGKCGATGNATGPHLHVQIENGGPGGALLNPINYFGEK